MANRYVVIALLLTALVTSVFSAAGNGLLPEDLIMSLCAGRDVAEGRLGLPDTWSFATGGAVWVNQGWLSCSVLFKSFILFGIWGPLGIKLVVILASLALILIRLAFFKVSGKAALAAAALGLLSVAPLVSIRAELFGLICFLSFVTFFSAPRTFGPARQAGCLCVMAIWGNCHGSFMIGFALLCIRAFTSIATRLAGLIGSRSRRRPDTGQGGIHASQTSEDVAPTDASAPSAPARSSTPRGRWDWITWPATLFSAILIVGFLNPYGLRNLTMPFTQTESELWTQVVPMWGPLIRWSSVSGLDLFNHNRSLLFVLLLIFTAVLCVSVFIKGEAPRRARGYLKELRQRVSVDWLAEILAVLFMCALTFRFGRTALFTGVFLAPIIGILLRSWSFAMRAEGSPPENPARRRAALTIETAGALCLALVSAWLFYSKIMPSYTANPITGPVSPERTAFGDIYADTTDMRRFFRENAVEGRVFTNMVLADVFLLENPGVQIFLDCRAQSIYSNKAFSDYMTIMRTSPDDDSASKRSLKTLDEYGAQAVALQDVKRTQPLKEVLYLSDQWRLIYMDSHGSALVKKDSPVYLSHKTDDGDLDFRYPTRASELLSNAYHQFQIRRRISPRLEADLMKSAAERPLWHMYRIVALSNIDQAGRLNERIAQSFQGEASRLLKDFDETAFGAADRLIAVKELLRWLERDAGSRNRKVAAIQYARLRNELNRKLLNLYGKYLPQW